jgi:hypothetical protein
MRDLPVVADGGAVNFPIEKPAKEINCKSPVVPCGCNAVCDCEYHIGQLYCHQCRNVTRYIMERYIGRNVECVFCSGKQR